MINSANGIQREIKVGGQKLGTAGHSDLVVLGLTWSCQVHIY